MAPGLSEPDRGLWGQETHPMDQLPSTIIKAMPSYKALAQALGQFRKAMSEVGGDVQQVKRVTTSDAARLFVAYKSIKDELDDLQKAFEAEYTEFKTLTFPGLLEDDGQTNVPLAEGYRVGVSTKLYASIKGERKGQAYGWLRNNDLGELIVETVNASTLSAAAKALLEDKFLDLPDGLFNVMLQSNTSVTKTKK